jgi:hypothetical protein
MLRVLFILSVIAAAVSISSFKKTRPQVPLECKGAQSLTYTYEVDGDLIIDLDTGAIYNWQWCIPLRFRQGDY